MEVPNRERAVDEINVFEPCPFSKSVEGNEPGVHGGVTPRCAFVGGVLLEVDRNMMGGPGRNHHETMERLRRFFSLEMASFDQRRCFIRWRSAHVARHKLEAPGEHGEALSFV